MSDLRTLAQAVVDAVAVYEADPRASAPWNPVRDALEELGMFLGGGVGVTHARAILAALDAERAQGYARAMGKVVERCAEEAADCEWGTSPYGVTQNITKWARERLGAWRMSDPILNTEALRWLLTGEVGVSSKFIVERITGFDRKPAEHPWDTGDFMRCEKMLRSCPSIRARFSEMAAASPEWAALVASWDAIRVAIRDGHHGAAHDMIEAAVYRRGT